MGTQLVEVTTANQAYLCLAGFLVFFSAITLVFREKLYLGECVLATAFGIAIGKCPHGAGIFDPRSWGSTNLVTLEVLRVILATGVFAIEIELPRAYMRRRWRSQFFMLVPVMIFGWLISSVLIFALFPKLDFKSSLLISACLTPTDPILSVAITMGKFALNHVPEHIRLLIAGESAANDGMAYPFLTLPLYLIIEHTTGASVRQWFLVGVLYQVILGCVLGAIFGSAFRYLLRFAQERGFINTESFVAQHLALAIFVMGLANLLGCDELLAAFSAGTALSWDGHFKETTESAIFASILDLVLNSAGFIYIGAWIPFQLFNAPELGIVPWRLIVLGISLILVRRIPATIILQPLIPDLHNMREALFVGHFGPMGVGAIYISTLAVTKLPQTESPPANQAQLLASVVQPIVSFVVLVSIIVHGLSIPFFTLGKRVRTFSVTSSRMSRANSNRDPEWLMSTRPASEIKQGLNHTVVSLEQKNADDTQSLATTTFGGARNDSNLENSVHETPARIPTPGVEPPAAAVTRPRPQTPMPSDGMLPKVKFTG
ncbi:hypothetical protein SISNIDRAFT_488345 [Sistotremastrum niveocremeum HHB9708]|uniref:Cation/H+ exchanger transmembrane domain-containing protein n=1 Tax=Sistotremastrum niveocremeum HHB9708 TaxID=1314777 RepID=A0A164RDQ4_9AGAM|nr:hypothetical protein SISNIDRAFT_488345 [Sistotremastrum niveocremeum HHB9708]